MIRQTSKVMLKPLVVFTTFLLLLWIRGFFASDWVSIHTDSALIIIDSSGGLISIYGEFDRPDLSWDFKYGIEHARAQSWTMLAYEHVIGFEFKLAISLLAFVFGCISIALHIINIDTREAGVAGFCPNCSYDLRASTNKCPECGCDFK